MNLLVGGPLPECGIIHLQLPRLVRTVETITRRLAGVLPVKRLLVFVYKVRIGDDLWLLNLLRRGIFIVEDVFDTLDILFESLQNERRCCFRMIQ